MWSEDIGHNNDPIYKNGIHIGRFNIPPPSGSGPTPAPTPAPKNNDSATSSSYSSATDVVTLTGKLGAGLGVHAKVFGIGLTIEPLKIYSVCDSNGFCGTELEIKIMLEITKKIGVGVEVLRTMDVSGNVLWES